MKKLCLLVLMWVPLAALAETVKLLPSPLEMPRHIGPLVNDGAPYAFPEPELGVAYQYNGDGLSLTIYVYDLGIKDIADGPDTTATCEQYEEAKQEVFQARYPKTRLKSEQRVRLAPPDDTPLAREALFELDINKRPALSYLWITGVAKQFIKLRFSVDAELRDEVPEARRAILTAFGEAVKPHLAAVMAAEQKTAGGTSININPQALAVSEDDASTGMMYLMFLSALAEKDSQSTPPCGGMLEPTYGTELSAYESMLHSDVMGKSGFGQKLMAIEQAGFLKEFVWADLHREGWGKDAPEGLKLSAYQKWRKKNLKGFKVPAFGSVSINRVRSLPLEAPDAP